MSDGAGDVLRRAGVSARHGERTDEAPVVERTGDRAAERRRETGILDTRPQTEEVRQRGDQLRRLRAEHDVERAQRILAAAEIDLILDRRTVLVGEARFERHGLRVRREKRHQLVRGGNERLDGLENIVDAPLRRGDGDVLGQDAVHQRRAVRAQPMRQRVDLPHHLVRERQAV